MGFFTGRASFTRFRVTGPSSGAFGSEHLKRLAEHAIGKQPIASGDGVEVGWIAGDDILDSDFDLAKNIVDDTLHFALRIDTQKLPADLLRSYIHVELKALSAQNPSGRPSARQRREARDSARERLEQEARGGRFLRRKAFPMLWDGQAKELLVASTSVTAIDRLVTLFQETFHASLENVGAGDRAFLLAEAREQTRGVEDARPSHFVVPGSADTVHWLPDEASRDFLGNEFLLWLWYYLEVESDTIRLSDGSDVTAMLTRSLVLECPRDQSGRETITSEGPSRLPETFRAIQSGKLPRRAGLTLVRHGQQVELTLQAETLAVQSAKFPAAEEDEDRARLEERIRQIRGLIETLDLLYDTFLRGRLGAEWTKELAQMQQWLQRGERERFSPAA